ncbi:MAG: hypothetical protein HY606_12890 [Planctomycetes bacterium]|nr:hypothetical protein [Planctomycetota bacterium]
MLPKFILLLVIGTIVTSVCFGGVDNVIGPISARNLGSEIYKTTVSNLQQFGISFSGDPLALTIYILESAAVFRISTTFGDFYFVEYTFSDRVNAIAGLLEIIFPFSYLSS